MQVSKSCKFEKTVNVASAYDMHGPRSWNFRTQHIEAKYLSGGYWLGPMKIMCNYEGKNYLLVLILSNTVILKDTKSQNLFKNVIILQIFTPNISLEVDQFFPLVILYIGVMQTVYISPLGQQRGEAIEYL